LPKITESATVEVLDILKYLFTKQYKTIPSNNEVKIPLDNLAKGTYLFIVTQKKNEKLQTKFIIE
jgi:hypothetical protein